MKTIKTGAGASPRANSPVQVLLLLGLITAIGAVLRIHLLGLRSYWVDETFSVSLARLPFRAFLWNLWNYEGNMAFYYFLLRGWLHLGAGETLVRAFSVLAGVATIPAIYAMGARLFDRRAGFSAAALLALHSFHIRYSQEARSYSLLVLLLVLSTFAFALAVESPGKKRYWGLYALASSLAIYSHLFASFVLAAQWMSLTPAMLRRIGVRRIFTVALSIALLSAPMVAFALLKYGGQLDWIPTPSVETILVFVNYLGAYAGPVIFAGYAVLSLAALRWRPASNFGEASDQQWRVRLLYFWFLFPILATLVLSIYKPLFNFRYMIMCLPPLILLAALGISALENLSERKWLAPLAFSFIIAGSFWGVTRYYRGFVSYDNGWRGATTQILSAQEPGDALLIDDSTSPVPYELYLKQEWTERSLQFSPTRLSALHTGSLGGTRSTNEEVARTAAQFRRIWTVQQGVDSGIDASVTSFMPLGYVERFRKVIPGVESTPIVLRLYEKGELETRVSQTSAVTR